MPALETIVDSSSEVIGFKASIVKGLREKFHEAAVEATKEVFEGEILPAAKAGTPVLTGANRDSIQVSFRDRLETSWISAWIFTESGYGWLIERGTSHNRALTKTKVSKRKSAVVNDRTRAHPYIYPAIVRFVQQIPIRAKQIFEQGSK